MHSTQDVAVKATAELHFYLEQQVNRIAPEPIKVRIPQRKAKYHDKTRVRFADIKRIALRDCKCVDTSEIKRRLKLLGVKLDLRLTSAWIALAWELQHALAVIPPLKTVMLTNTERLEQAVENGVLAAWKEDEEGGLYWIWTAKQERELVTSSGLPMYLRQLG